MLYVLSLKMYHVRFAAETAVNGRSLGFIRLAVDPRA